VQRNAKILFLTPYPEGESPSQRFRFEQYYQLLNDEGCIICRQGFLSKDNWKIFYRNGQALAKIWTLFAGFAKRLLILLRVPGFDFIFIHREITPVGPPLFEWIIAKILRKKIIYDFDDAIWLTDRENEPPLLACIKSRWKVARICRWSYKVSCGNQFLCDYARQFNSSVLYMPTTIDTTKLHNPELYEKEKRPEVIIGWTGSFSTLKYLKEIESVLTEIENRYPHVTIWVISDKQPDLKVPRLVFRQWSLGTEIADLRQFDIGIMPLPNDQWAKGKCGFKALQYMALGIPPVVSPVGVNSIIVESEKTGLFAATSSQWLTAITTLIENELLLESFGQNGRKQVQEFYSVESRASSFLWLFEKLRINNIPVK
jgi:glycosyltransferase involved in cell wall biosynthesis